MGEAAIRRIKDDFTSTYLTLVSIVQGVVLSTLVVNVTTSARDHHLALPVILEGVNSFLMIVILWNEYMMGSNAFEWVPAIFDSIVPFALAITELFIVNSIGDAKAWLLFMGLAWFAGMFAFVNSYVRAYFEPENINHGILGALGWHIPFSLVYCLVGVSVHVVLGLVVGLHADWAVVALSLSTAILLTFLVRAAFYWHAVVTYFRPRELALFKVDVWAILNVLMGRTKR
jgi:hypothetical protein